MRDYGRVFSSFWQSVEIRKLSNDGKMLALYLLTCPHANLIGCYRLPDAYAADDLDWGIERVWEGLNELSRSGFIVRCDATKWILICKYIAWNRFENGNVATAAAKAYDQVPQISLKNELAKALLEFGTFLKEPFVKGLETVLQPFVNPILNPSHPEPEPEPEPQPEPEPSQSLTIFEHPPLGATRAKKNAAEKKEPSQTGETWQAYETAYERRYGVKPVRNATVNGQLSNFVKRVGVEEAPHIAAWFIGHQNRFYVEKGHSVGMLAVDAEKLRTQWATNNAATSTQALQADKTYTNFSVFDKIKRENEIERSRLNANQ